MKNMLITAIAGSAISTASNSFAEGSDALSANSSSLIAGSELNTLCLLLAISVAVGLVIGLIFRKWTPQWCLAYSNFCRGKTWPFLVGAVYFGCLSLRSYADEKPYFGTFFAIAAVLQVLAWVSKLLSKRPEKL